MGRDLSRYYEAACLNAAVANPLQRVSRPGIKAPWYRFVQPLSGPYDRNRRSKRERLFTAEVVARLREQGLVAPLGDEIHATAAGLARLQETQR